jgi:DNA-binding beta-propeller fold protein YncE
LELSPDGKLLFAVNTPDNRLEIFKVTGGGLTHRGSVPVGLEPVAVAARSNTEVWVVNHLSDSVSVVEVSPGGNGGRVTRTLLVGDEPRDIVFAGPGKSRAFITTAHRGQNAPYDPQLTTPGIGRADVWVFDANALGQTLGGMPITILSLFTDTPRALAVTPDGSRVYAAGFHTGNRTTTIHHMLIPDGGQSKGGLPAPNTSVDGAPQPEVGLIVKYDGAHWVDELGRTWVHVVRFSLPDKDVFVLDAMANPPVQLPGQAGFFSGVGTILYNLAVNPVSGKVYASNTEAFNEQRFEGPGEFAGHTVRGRFHHNRITVLSSAGVAPRHLNKHIDYDACCAPRPNPENQKSLALPTAMAVTSDGATLYVAALGSDKVGIFSTAELENDTFVPDTARQIPLSHGGPTGLVLDERRHRLYVMTRFDNSITIVDTRSRAEVGNVRMHNPEPASVVQGRRFLYDASLSSRHGDSSCATCHVFGDFDSLAWDLGNPDNGVETNPGPFIGSPIINPDFHPLKGPMATQSLRGMANHGPMHWRADRTGGNDEPSAQPDSGSFNEEAAFKQFAGAFTDLLGRDAALSDAEMQAFTDFILQVTYPPNPVRALDNSLTPAQQQGRDFFFDVPSNIVFHITCEACHVVDPAANPGSVAPGFFGADGSSAFPFGSQVLKVPHLRNMYQKVGMFGMAQIPVINPGDNGFKGDQVRGFGFIHDGSVDTMFRFVSVLPFTQGPDNPTGLPANAEGDAMRRKLEDFMLVFDSNLAPIVGQQVTLTRANAAAVNPRINLLIARANAGECALVAKTQHGQHEQGFLYNGSGRFLTDRARLPALPDAALRLLASTGRYELTYTCVPPGSGRRIGIDRDGDGFLDGDERDAGSNPADPVSRP